MLKIGDFSKVSLVSVKALRYYDELGLLKPARVDALTGYRYYSASQLPRLNRILVLKDLGLSLQQIAHLLDQELTPDQIFEDQDTRSEEHTSELQSHLNLVCRLLLEKKKT